MLEQVQDKHPAGLFGKFHDPQVASIRWRVVVAHFGRHLHNLDGTRFMCVNARPIYRIVDRSIQLVRTDSECGCVVSAYDALSTSRPSAVMS